MRQVVAGEQRERSGDTDGGGTSNHPFSGTTAGSVPGSPFADRSRTAAQSRSTHGSRSSSDSGV